MSAPVFDRLLKFLNRLGDSRIHYTLRHSRDEAIMVNINVPGERWEVEFLRDGDVDVEIFRSDGAILDEPMIEQLIANHSSTSQETSLATSPKNGAVLNK
jgi:hypothetical protein